LKNIQLCNDYLLRIINFINNLKNRETPIESKGSDLLYLQKKRKSEESFFDCQWNCMTPKKDIDFPLLKKTDGKTETNAFSSEPIGLSNYNSSNEHSFEYKNKNQNSGNRVLNEIENLIKKIINSNNENKKIDLKENDLDFHKKLLGNEKNDIAKNNDIFSLLNVNNKSNDFIENNCSKKKNEDNSKKSEMKVMKNNKLVYLNSKKTYFYHHSNYFQKSKKIFSINAGRRSSQYRGVSKNGNQWQVLIMCNKSKSYAGTYTCENLAARVYDILAIKNKGNKAKTNFKYSESQKRKICNTDIDFKAKNLDQIIYDLLKDK